MKLFKHDMASILKKWLTLGFCVTAILFFTLVVVRQDLRLSADDTQAEIAGNVELALADGTPFKYFSSANPVKIGKSLTPYVILYDRNGVPLAGNGSLDGNFPVPPKGTFDYLLAHGEDRFTWEPIPGVREAVVARVHGDKEPVFIVVGRSLVEVESHISELTRISIVFWVVSMLGSFALTAVLS
jgi:hypothetical protein